jgi:protein gp37
MDNMIQEYFHVLPAFDWVIVGGESGNENGKYKYRPCELEWIESIVNQCQRNDIPVFVKQLGTFLSKQLKLSDRHGGNINDWPANLQVRQFPTTLINNIPITKIL